MISTTIYLVLEPIRTGYSGNVVGLAVDRMTKSYPSKLGVRHVAVQVNIECDERMFVTPKPEVTISLNDARALVVPKLDVLAQPEDEEGEREDDTNYDVVNEDEGDESP